MNHAQNERIALHLRALADKIEKSTHEYTSEMGAYGGEPLSFSATGKPIKFGPIGYSIILGDEGFVSGHQVACVGPTGI